MPVPSTSVPIRRALLREDVYARLRDAIVDCTFEPGEQLRDQELAAWLGVSRTPVREALLRLGEAGLVRAEPGRSTTVAPLDHAAVRDAQSVVAAMHRLAVAEAIAALSPADLDRMRAANRRFAAAVAAGDVHAALAADDDFHAVPVRVSGNAALRAVLAQYGPVLRRLELLRFGSAQARACVERHDRLVELCAAGDAAAAEVSHDTWKDLTSVLDDPAARDPRPPLTGTDRR
ncbi:GntR family transcriptional regulator [Actinokineospora bangkokensis]|uniref:GntR family transcriptional regulator n=1 Tax=Actinokineospora bangkokensis TaxID=1193682 RepID=A0A1Q9LNR5_9PSEU|nr:GntR family transcriptional regulator [Actinokineospora bangkokensis]OLR93643.1 GntR family transcriptional regulator [Actinokineospora bangkokensis]